MKKLSEKIKERRQSKLRKKEINKESPAPDVSVANHLIYLFDSQHFEEAHALSSQLIQKYPNNYFAWMMLGSILNKLGNVDASNVALNRSSELAPNEAIVLSNLSNAFHDADNFIKAEEYARKANYLDPNLVPALNNLAHVLISTFRFDEAIDILLLALRNQPDFTQALNNMGFALIQKDSPEEALKYLTKATQLNPSYLLAQLNLANAKMMVHQYGGSEQILLNIISVNIKYSEAHAALGSLYQKLGKMDEAGMCFDKAVQLDPSSINMYGYASFLIMCGKYQLAKAMLQSSIDRDPKNIGLMSAVELSVLNYLDNDYNSSVENILKSSDIFTKGGLRFKFSTIYWVLMNSLLKIDKSSNALGQLHNQNKIFVIGESHCLSAHGSKVAYLNETFFCQSKWIPGAKQWDFAQSENNGFKEALKLHVGSLPDHSSALLCFGEIDCRINSGIFKLCKNKPEMNMNLVITNTIEGYLKFIDEICLNRGFQLIIQGIPAPCHHQIEGYDEDKDAFIKFVREFNEQLRERVHKNGYAFLDVYRLSARDDGLSNREWHIDNYHLKPQGIVKAFAEFLMFP